MQSNSPPRESARGKAEILPAEFFQDIDRSGHVPLYYQVASRIENAIRTGRLPTGSRLENEITLSERLGMSRPTVRRAIQEVVDKGLLVRRRGVGTQVVHGQVTRQVEFTSLHEDLALAHRNPSTTVLLHEVVSATGSTARHLAVEEGSPVLHLRRLRSAGGSPLAVLENYLPEEFTDLTEEALTEFGLYHLLRSRGTALRVARQKISARRATNEERSLLEIEKGDPVLTMERTAYDHSGGAVEYGQHCYRPDLYSFEVTLVYK